MKRLFRKNKGPRPRTIGVMSLYQQVRTGIVEPFEGWDDPASCGAYPHTLTKA